MTRTPPTLQAALQASRLAEALTAEQTAQLATAVELRAVGAGTVLAREAAPDQHLYALVDGALQVITQHGTPQQVLVTTLQPGDLSHELGFLDGAERFASLVAAGDVHVLVLARDRLRELLDRHPRVVWGVWCAIARNVHRRQTQLAVEGVELANYVFKQHGRY